MKRWIVMLTVVLAMTPLAGAQDAAKRAKVEELITLLHMDRMMDQMMQAMKTQVEQTVQQTPGIDQLTADQKKLLADFEEQSMQMISDGLGWKALEPDFVTLYTQTFSDEEIDGMIAFYRSPPGQAVLSKMPQLMTAGVQIAQRRMVDIQPKLKALQEQFMKQIAANVPASEKSRSPAKKD